MTRLPTIGDDLNNWGTVLNAFLQVGHNAGGTLSNAMTVFNVKDDAYGALGDGSHDDTTAIAAALAALGSAGGGAVFFPSGTYLVSADLIVPSNTSCIGTGRGSILKIIAGTGHNNCLKLSSVSHVAIKDMAFDGNKANVSYPGGITYDHLQPIYILNSDDVAVENCYIHDGFSSGIMAQGSTNLIVRGNRIINCGDNQIYVRAGLGTPYTPCQYGTISGNICSSGAFSGIQILGSSYFAITGNTCYNNGPSSGQGNGIGSEGASHLTIAGNICYNNGVQGIQIRETEEVGVAHSKSSHIVISGNECYGNTSSDGDAGGISVSDADDILLSGNLTYGNYYGININGGAGAGMGVMNVHLAGNEVRGNTSAGVRVAPESNYYDHLVLNDPLGVPIRYYKLEEASGATATDSGSQATNGTYAGSGITYHSTKLITDSSATYSVLLNGSSGNVTVPTTGLPTGAQPWSIDAWYQDSSAPSDFTAVIGFGTYGSAQHMAVLYIMNNLSVTLSTYSGDIGSNSNLAPTGKPHYIAGTYDGTKIYLYVDGVQVNNTALTMAIALAFANIGSQQSSARLTGNVTRGAWYNYALSPAQIAARYSAGKYLFNISMADNAISNNGSDNIVTTTQLHINGGVISNSGSGHMGLSLQTGANGTSAVGVDFLSNGDSGVSVSGGAGPVSLRDCLFDNPGPATQLRAVNEDASSGPTSLINCIIQNQVTQAVSLSGPGVHLLRGNVGLNPIGQVSAPSFPSSTVAVTNNSGYDITAFIVNGTSAITQVQIAGAGGSYVNTNFQIAASGWGAIRIPAGGSVKFTYASGAPTWTWFGD